MKALIFNSGTGSRMGKLTEDKPKCLLPLPGGETILSRQLRLLAASGIRQAVITTGAYTEQIRQQADGSGLDITLVENPLYRETNYIYSMHLAQEVIQGSDLLMLHGDLVFDTHVLEKLLKTQFKPEFLNRLDEVVFYTPLTRDQISGILQLMLKDLSGRLADRHLSVELTDAAKEYVIDNGYDPVYGARPLKRFLQRAVETPIARMLIAEDVPEGSEIVVDVENGEITVKHQPAPLVADVIE